MRISANALLKVLEEPPPRAVLMLISAAPGRLLPTIRSRCRHLPLTPLSHADLGRAILSLYLPGLGASERERLSRLAEGAPGRALALAEQGGLAIAGLVAEIMGALPEVPVLRGYEIADGLREEEALRPVFLSAARRDRQCRDGAFARCGRCGAGAVANFPRSCRVGRALVQAWRHSARDIPAQPGTPTGRGSRPIPAQINRWGLGPQARRA